MIHRILVPLDGSALAEMILPCADELARLTGATVIFLRSVEPRGPDHDRATSNSWLADAVARGQAYLDTVARQFEDAGIATRTQVTVGAPAQPIIQAASGADLVAMSTHGRSGVGRWRRGSVADQVVRGAPVPVLLVHADQTEVVATGHPQRILVPLDGSALAEGALPLALCLARLAHASLVLVRAVNRPRDLSTTLTALGPIVGAELGALDEERARSYLAGVSQRLLHQGVPVTTTVYRDPPADAILACATEERADLIVMTTHGCGGLGRWALGSVADRVLSAAAMPVLLVRSTVAGHAEAVMGHEERVLTSHNAA